MYTVGNVINVINIINVINVINAINDKMTNQSAFGGAWLVSEYVYNSDGAFAGIVRQRRELRRRRDGDLDVVQYCVPGPELAGHPMGEFSGERVFLLRTEGRFRRYLGPDVIGSGLGWGAGALTGRGVWPRFGHNFTSFSVIPAPDRQITGGQFFNAGERIANIMGLAVPETDGADYPTFEGPTWPAEMASQWCGLRRRIDGSGALLDETFVARDYDGSSGYREPDFEVSLLARGPRIEIGGTVMGIAKRSGWMIEGTGVAGPDMLEFFDVFDPLGGHVISVRRWSRDEALRQVEIVMLKEARAAAGV